jgi:Novel STAND NTPase 3
VLGPNQLWELLLARPALRFRLPFLLGLAERSLFVGDDVAGRSSADIDGAAAIARVFVPTRGYHKALEVLQKHRFVVLTGPPEMGKTAIARLLGLAALSDGWELHECLRPDELWQRFARGRRQVFIADDAFGSTEYRPDAAERWALDLDRVLRALDDEHWLIWTSRPAPLKAALRHIHREHGVERFPQPAEVGVDAAELDVTEKALILFRHTKAAEAPDRAVTLVREHGWQIVSHPHFTPERIRRFVGGRLLELSEQADDADIEAAVAAEIRTPTTAMAESYRALAPDHRAVLLALLDTAPGPVNERELTAAVRRHSPSGLAHPISEIVDRLADHFLRPVHPAGVTWVHPSWRDLVIDELAADDQGRRDFLAACSIQGAALALSTAGGSTGERALPLLRRDADWDALADRLATLLPELDAPETTLILHTLAEARTQAHDPVVAELGALAAETLSQLARSWHAALPVGVLTAWLTLAASLDEAPQPPVVAIAATWIELVPDGAPDLTAAGQLAALDDWLALAELLDAGAPEILRRFDFPELQTAALRSIIAVAEATPFDGHAGLRDLLVAVLRRLARLVPVLAYEAREAAIGLAEADRPAPEPDVPLRELSPETERLLDQPLTSTRSDHVLVGRVLRDL